VIPGRPDRADVIVAACPIQAVRHRGHSIGGVLASHSAPSSLLVLSVNEV